MANHIAKTVCWANAEEWQRVATLLYSSDSKYVRSGVDHIAGWMSRGTVPLAVECTYHLLKVTLSDPDNGIFSVPNGSLICESSILRLAYSMALTRFVNGFCDAGQKGFAARSVARIAEDLGIPDYIVDVRHQSTHTALPSVETLRLDVPVALDWLRERYWNKQEQLLSDTKQKVASGIKNILVTVAAFDTHTRSISPTFNSRQRKKFEQDSAKYIADKDRRTYAVTQMVHANSVQALIVDTLLQDGMLLPDASSDDDVFGQSLTMAPTEEECTRRFHLWDDAIQGFDAAWQYFSSELLADLVHEISNYCCTHARDSVTTLPTFQGHESSAFEILAADASATSAASVRLQWLVQWCLHLVTHLDLDVGVMRALLMQLVSFPNVELIPLVKVLLAMLNKTLPSGTDTKVLMMMELGSRMPTSLFRRKLGAQDTQRARLPDVSTLTQSSTDRTALAEASRFLTKSDAMLVDMQRSTSERVREDLESQSLRKRRRFLASAWDVVHDGRWIGQPVGLLPDGSVPDLSCDAQADDCTNGDSDSDNSSAYGDDEGDSEHVVGPTVKRRRKEIAKEKMLATKTALKADTPEVAHHVSTIDARWVDSRFADALVGAVQLL